MKYVVMGLLMFFIALIIGSVAYGLIAGGGSKKTEAVTPGIFVKTIDGGITWQSAGVFGPATRGGTLTTTTVALGISEAGEPVYYLGTLNNGLWQSADLGKDWTEFQAETYPREGSVQALAIDKVNPFNFFAAIFRGDRGQILRTKTAGQTFQTVFEANAPKIYISAMAVEPDNHATIYAGTNEDGLMVVSDDFGTHWRYFYEFKDDILAIVPSHRGAPEIYVLTRRNVWRFDGAGTWSKINDNRKARFTGRLRRLIEDPKAPGKLFVAAGSDLWTTPDKGETWTQLFLPAHRENKVEITDIALSPVEPNRLAVAYSTVVLMSPSAGRDWRVQEPPVRRPIARLIYDPKDPLALFITTQ